jgi:hypothetical protein
MDGLELKQLNSFLSAYANLNAKQGTLSVDAEFQAKGGRFDGYVKPFIHDLQVLDWKQENESLFQKMWEATAQLVGDVLTNHSDERIATRIPIRGTFDQPDTGVWPAIGGLLKNAFIVGLQRGLENSLGHKLTGETSAQK